VKQGQNLRGFKNLEGLSYDSDNKGQRTYPTLANSLKMNYTDIITIEPNKRSGKPCIRGLRITVYDVLEYLAGGMTEDEILEDFPELTRDDIKACLAFAADRERKLFVAPIITEGKMPLAGALA
jgi:uncharacterized protein (DUF433 family)